MVVLATYGGFGDLWSGDLWKEVVYCIENMGIFKIRCFIDIFKFRI